MTLTVGSLYALTQKGMTWDWTDLEQTAFIKAKKQLIVQVQALTVIKNGEPLKLDVTI
jgi:hypothetical protein